MVFLEEEMDYQKAKRILDWEKGFVMSRCAKGDLVLVLLGNPHFGTAQQITSVQRHLDWHHASGFKIFYEQVRGWGMLAHNATEHDRSIARFLSATRTIAHVGFKRLGFLFHYENLVYPAGSQNADIRFSELVQRLADEGYKDFSTFSGPAKTVLLDYRNAQALGRVEAYFAAGAGKNALIHYGDGHVFGMEELLRKKGWVVQRLQVSWDSDLRTVTAR